MTSVICGLERKGGRSSRFKMCCVGLGLRSNRLSVCSHDGSLRCVLVRLCISVDNKIHLDCG